MLYTRKGDKGTTKVFDSKERFSKGSDLAEALGTLDELNSFVGLCKVKACAVQEEGLIIGKKKENISDILREIQGNLFIIQAEIAGAQKRLGKAKVLRLEKLTDAIEKEIPPIKSFTIAGGTELSAMLDVARTMARRTERRMVIVHDAGLRKLGISTRAYANRLSSLLFALARLVNHKSGITEKSPDYK
jgi:cob(I)alamin adenosyltransferase